MFSGPNFQKSLYQMEKQYSQIEMNTQEMEVKNNNAVEQENKEKK